MVVGVVGVAAGSVLLALLVAYVFWVGLDRADKFASVASSVAAFISLGMGSYQLRRQRQESRQSRSEDQGPDSERSKTASSSELTGNVHNQSSGWAHNLIQARGIDTVNINNGSGKYLALSSAVMVMTWILGVALLYDSAYRSGQQSVIGSGYAVPGPGPATSSPGTSGPVRTLQGQPVLPVGIKMKESLLYAFPDAKSYSASELNELTAVTMRGEYGKWVYAHGASPFWKTEFSLVLQGNGAQAVRILDIRPVKTCSAPLSGTILVPQGGGYVDPSIRIGFNLDRVNPQAQIVDERGVFGADYFTQNTVALAAGQQQTFQVMALTEKYYCEFRLRLTVVADNKQVDIDVDNAGEVFRVTAESPQRGKGQYSGYAALYVRPLTESEGAMPWIREAPETWVNR